jgi:hypothetical protein
MRKVGVTLQRLWVEYRDASVVDPELRRPYGYSQFCDLYRTFRAHVDVKMRQPHRAGEKLIARNCERRRGRGSRASCGSSRRSHRYEIAESKKARASIDYHVEYDFPVLQRAARPGATRGDAPRHDERGRDPPRWSSRRVASPQPRPEVFGLHRPRAPPEVASRLRQLGAVSAGVVGRDERPVRRRWSPRSSRIGRIRRWLPLVPRADARREDIRRRADRGRVPPRDLHRLADAQERHRDPEGGARSRAGTHRTDHERSGRRNLRHSGLSSPSRWARACADLASTPSAAWFGSGAVRSDV